ncbi:MAG TPA: glycosyltransferase family 9 protein [Ilumatobacteraceae bacterium]|nr:glycosyltransferase family 9 protein [Ilumatobacteraceae bacterium]
MAERPTVLVARLDSLGDVLLTEPAVRAIAESTRVVMLCSSQGARAAELLDAVDQVVVYDSPWIVADPDPVDSPAFDSMREQLVGLAADSAIIFSSAHQSSLPTALMLRLAGVPRIGAYSQAYAGSLLDVRLRDDPLAEAVPHEVERNLALVEAMGYSPPTERRMMVQGHWLPADVANDLPPHFVVVHPGSAGSARTLPAARWAAIVEALTDAGHTVVLTGIPDERTLRVVNAAPKAISLVGRTEFGQLATVLARAEALCVGNTGAMHLAAAVGTPVVACMPPTVPIEGWRPWMVDHSILNVDVPCAPCYQQTCPYATHPCTMVEPHDVVQALERLVRRRAQHLPALGVA